MKIAIIGCGNMGSALAKRLSLDNEVFLYDRNKTKIDHLQSQGFGISCETIEEALKEAEILFLAIKPQSLEKAVENFNLKPSRYTIISLLAGINGSTLKRFFPSQKIVRIMPNLAISYGDGVVAVEEDKEMSSREKLYIGQLLNPLGKVYWISEAKMNAFTSLAGSGPAFFLTMIETMIESGIAMGFTSQDATDLTIQMMKGTLSVLEKSEKHPAELKWQVTSPAGTTIAGLAKLEETGLRNSIYQTFLAAYNRAHEFKT
ncbi:MAG: pyrroline-5-carboxylate reductase [Chlamydia sp. 32-24]|nr:MAG: pyrroline-5-carboxylate reductase [Chlamydia sp. 32-24]